MTAYHLRLPVFEGPLDLLLQLIERHQLDITTVSLALVTDQYLEHLRTGEGVDPEQLSEFIAVAAKLLLIKSAALLPRPTPIRPEAASDPADPTDLTERLRLYESVRKGAAYLRQREEADLRSYPHPPPTNALDLVARPVAAPPPDGRPVQPPSALAAAFLRVLRRPRPPSAELPREVWTVAEAIVWLRDLVHGLRRSTFTRLTAGLDRERVVAAFLALLELHRLGKLRAGQAEPFGEIDLAPGDAP